MKEIRSLLQKVYHQSPVPVVMTLATLGCDGAPRARSMVCRDITTKLELVFVSDSRSEKSSQLIQSPGAEVVWWIPDRRWQFRFRGSVTIKDSQTAKVEVRRRWKELSPATREMFFWPEKGNQSPVGTIGRLKISEYFQVLTLIPTRIEQLDLNLRPHRLRHWSIEGNWRRREL